MSISFTCDCGKGFTVADEFAGKRTKCPACGAGLTVPAPAAPESEPLSDEDKAFRALEDAPDAEPTAAPPRRNSPPADPPPSRPTSPPPAPIPAKKRGPRYEAHAAEDGGRSGYSGIHLTPAVAGGLFSMALGAGWCALVWSSGRFTIYGPILFVFGLVAVVRGLLGYSED